MIYYINSLKQKKTIITIYIIERNKVQAIITGLPGHCMSVGTHMELHCSKCGTCSEKTNPFSHKKGNPPAFVRTFLEHKLGHGAPMEPKTKDDYAG
jgi:hypothetical protein